MHATKRQGLYMEYKLQCSHGLLKVFLSTHKFEVKTNVNVMLVTLL
jgi:hypothetical protein